MKGSDLLLGLSLAAASGVAASPSFADEPTSTVDIMDFNGVMSPGEKGVRELEELALYHTAAGQVLVATNTLPQVCSGVKETIVVNPNAPDPKWGASYLPILTKVLTHYSTPARTTVIGHTVHSFLADERAQVGYTVSEPGTEACVDAALGRVNQAFKDLQKDSTLASTCNVHADLLMETPRVLGVYVNCGPKTLPNNLTAHAHYYHQPGTTPKAR